MRQRRVTIRLDPTLGAAVREAAARSGLTLSAWLSAAAATRLRQDDRPTDCTHVRNGDDEPDSAVARASVRR